VVVVHQAVAVGAQAGEIRRVVVLVVPIDVVDVHLTGVLRHEPAP
jgi:hypothetical protein